MLNRQTTIFAYGFDAAGFEIRDQPSELSDGSRLEFVSFSNTRDLNEADGVIIPQGIFERIETRRTGTFGATREIWVDRSFLLERERQVFNLLRAGKWVCFLVSEIIDSLSQGLHSEPIEDTDLCKRVLNAFGVGRHHRYRLELPAEVRTRDREFESYVQAYGEPSTVFELPQHGQSLEKRVLVELTNNAVVGLEFDHQLFFLPFRSRRKQWPAVSLIAKAGALAVSSYRRKRLTAIPRWVDDIRFKSEEALYLEINSLLERLNRLEGQLKSWRDYKAILTASRSHLQTGIASILESFFDLKVDWLDENREEGMITAADGSPLAIFAARAENGALNEQWVERLISHRKSRGLEDTVPAIMFVNLHASLEDTKRRFSEAIPQALVQYATKHNALLMRTIDLLFLMQHLENNARRKDRLVQLLDSGGGWLRADQEKYRLVA
jgi:hypothetical protein